MSSPYGRIARERAAREQMELQRQLQEVELQRLLQEQQYYDARLLEWHEEINRNPEQQGWIMSFFRKIVERLAVFWKSLWGPGDVMLIGIVAISLSTLIFVAYWSLRNSKQFEDQMMMNDYLGISDLRNYGITNRSDSVDNEIRSNAPTISDQIDDSESECSALPLKVYMYDLPCEYNMGLVSSYDPNQVLPRTDLDLPCLCYGNNKQNTVEYWLMVYLLNTQDSEDGEMAAVRVNDPNQADVFFVPFFPALNEYAINMSRSDAEVAKHLEAGIVSMLHKSKWWQASQGRDHVIVAHHLNSFWHYRDILNKSIFILADFVRYNNSVARLEKDIIAPYVPILPTYKEDVDIDPFSTRKTLLFFCAGIHREADGSMVRAKLWELLMNETDFICIDFDNTVSSAQVSSIGLPTSTEGMRSSRFCLHPAGDTPSSPWLFDAIVNHCVPVIISDRIELPFEDDLDYNDFSVFFSAEDAIKPGHLLGTLRSMESERWTQMWNRLKAISHHFEYQYPSKKDDAVNMIFRQVKRKVPAVKLAIHRSRRLVVPDWYEIENENEDSS